MDAGLEQARLVLLAQSGDRKALDALLRSVQEPLYRYLLRLLPQKTLAEDILQEVLFLICSKIAWLREPEFFKAWTYRIATREAWKSLRLERRLKEQLLDEALIEQLPATSDIALEQWSDELKILVGQLSPACRAPLLMHYGDGLTLHEIAAVLDVSIGTVKSRLAYGLSTLRKHIQFYGVS